jgi:hypothetical protein
VKTAGCLTDDTEHKRSWCHLNVDADASADRIDTSESLMSKSMWCKVVKEQESVFDRNANLTRSLGSWLQSLSSHFLNVLVLYYAMLESSFCEHLLIAVLVVVFINSVIFRTLCSYVHHLPLNCHVLPFHDRGPYPPILAPSLTRVGRSKHKHTSSSLPHQPPSPLSRH